MHLGSQPASLVLRPFCYWFDSSQARKTMRWRRFRGLEFAPENEAKRAPMVHACLAAFGLLCQTMNRTPFTSVCGQSFSDRLFSAFFSARSRLGPTASYSRQTAPQAIVCFATDSIAAKPGKPCDGGIFAALNLLLFLQRMPTPSALGRVTIKNLECGLRGARVARFV